MTNFSLEEFEAYAYAHEHENAMRLLLELMGRLDSNYGLHGSDFQVNSIPSCLIGKSVGQYTWTRIVNAITGLMIDKNLALSGGWAAKILSLQRWISALYAGTPLVNADHILRSLSISNEPGQLSINDKDLLKFCLLYSPESEIPLDIDALYASNKELAVGLALALLSPRFLGSLAAHSKRENLLPWLVKKLTTINDIELLPSGILHDVYMHCSYADRADKHDIKKSINALIQRHLKSAGLVDSKRELALTHKKEKPVLLVVLEWFTKGHSIYRTHSRTLESARKEFNVIAMSYGNCIDEVTSQVFDEVVQIDGGKSIYEQISQISMEAEKRKAAILYMPSVGMFHLTMWLSNIRIAPLQIMALGHPATTHSSVMDYVVVEEDYVGEERCFSEKLLKLPADGMPYRPSADAIELNFLHDRSISPAVVRIAICSTTMKLNPGFLGVCSEILRRAKVRIEFHFLIGQAQGVIYPNVERVIKNYLGDAAIVYAHQPYKEYMGVILAADMFMNPFPFGNTNGIIDTVTMGLVGICKTGAEVHEHIDEGLFRRIGLPDWMITKNNEEYIRAVLRLAENHKERHSLSKKYSGAKALDVIFNGRPEIMGQLFLNLLNSVNKI